MPQASQVNVEVIASSTQDGESHTGYIRLREQLSDGTDVAECDLCYHAVLTIPYNSTPATLNLVDGSLTDINGDPMIMREAVTIFIVNLSDEESDPHIANANFDFGSSYYQWTEPLLGGGHIEKHAPVANAYPTLSADGPHITIDIVDGTNVEIEVLILGRSMS
jgi:hypothetical protein